MRDNSFKNRNCRSRVVGAVTVCAFKRNHSRDRARVTQYPAGVRLVGWGRLSVVRPDDCRISPSEDTRRVLVPPWGDHFCPARGGDRNMQEKLTTTFTL
jgi:hypothetical protein